jgi:hypothetical protein
MDQSQRIKAFVSLGNHLKNLSSQEVEVLSTNARNENTWFTRESIGKAISGVIEFLSEPQLSSWVNAYPPAFVHRKIALIMAGNIPLVGFHDLLATLIAGHDLLLKLSSKDQYLTKYVIEKLIEIEPSFREKISIEEQLKNFDAVIATGSDNSARYFDYYFGKYPHIIRKNRTSVAILTGEETSEDYEKLGTDIFTYYGLGCRNVSKIYIPKNFGFEKLFPCLEKFSEVINHHKYANNYDYQKSLLLINRVPFLDNGFVMLQENERIVSPISVVYYEYYDSAEKLKEKLNSYSDKIQIIIGNTGLCSVPFGEGQNPQLTDYADNVDTMKFLTTLE